MSLSLLAPPPEPPAKIPLLPDVEPLAFDDEPFQTPPVPPEPHTPLVPAFPANPAAPLLPTNICDNPGLSVLLTLCVEFISLLTMFQSCDG